MYLSIENRHYWKWMIIGVALSGRRPQHLYAVCFHSWKPFITEMTELLGNCASGIFRTNNELSIFYSVFILILRDCECKKKS